MKGECNQMSIRVDRTSEDEIAHALQHRYGDGDLCLPEGTPAWLVATAIRLGYLSEDGYLTRKGRQLLDLYQS